MFSQNVFFDSPSGARLSIRYQAASASARGILLISHGLAEHSDRYADFAVTLAGAGFHVYCHDHRGHGYTRAPDAPVGRFAERDGRTKVIADLASVRSDAMARHPGLPVILFGHSMGGLIALNAAEAEPSAYSGLAIWNSNFKAGMAGRAGLAVLAVERFLKGSDVPSSILPQLTFQAWARAIPARRTDFDWLSRDPAAVDRYIADPLCGFDATVSMWRDVLEWSLSGGQSGALARLPASLPVHIVGGAADPSTQKGGAMAWLAGRMRARGMADVTLVINPGMRHETVNEIGKEAAIAAFAAWCQRVAAAKSKR